MTAQRVLVDLQDGFEQDEVALSFGSREAWSGSSITTDPMLGLAATLELEVPGGESMLEVRIPSRGLETSVRLPPNVPDVHAGISVTEAMISVILADEPFGYA